MKNKVLYREYGVKVVPYSTNDFVDPADEEYRLEQLSTIKEDEEDLELSDDYFEMKTKLDDE